MLNTFDKHHHFRKWIKYWLRIRAEYGVVCHDYISLFETSYLSEPNNYLCLYLFNVCLVVAPGNNKSNTLLLLSKFNECFEYGVILI